MDSEFIETVEKCNVELVEELLEQGGISTKALKRGLSIIVCMIKNLTDDDMAGKDDCLRVKDLIKSAL